MESNKSIYRNIDVEMHRYSDIASIIVLFFRTSPIYMQNIKRIVRGMLMLRCYDISIYRPPLDVRAQQQQQQQQQHGDELFVLRMRS